MAKVTLTDLTSLANDTSATNSINTNFQTLEDYINDNVLSRDTGAETNTMQNDIDMNNYDLLNLNEINGESIADLITGASTARTAAEAAQTAAETAQTAAELAETNAAASYDSFDDRYLGAKASEPSLDNDGDALVAGALYYDTTTNEMHVYSGSVWEVAYLPASNYLTVSNNLSDLGSASTARTNLGVAIGSDVQAYDADTAKTDVEQTYTAAQTGSTQTNATATGNLTLDFSTYNNFVLTLTGNVTLDNPSTETVGQSGFIVFIQDGTGSRTVTLGTDYETPSAAGITLTGTAGTTDVVGYCVAASGRILLGSPVLNFS